MKNVDKGKRKYIGAVVVIALLAGIGLASADDTRIEDGAVWINNSDNPYLNALRVSDTYVNNGAAVVVDFTRTDDYQTHAYGVNVTGAQTARGSNAGIRGQTSINVPGYQEGLSVGYLAYTSGWYAHGHSYGVYGRSTPNSLRNWDDDRTSHGLGGIFYAGPDDTHTLTLNSAGTHWVGGVYGKVEGDIDGTPTAGAVAGVIGIDNTTGTAPSYAGYFDGRVYHEGNVGIGTTDPQRALHISDVLRLEPRGFAPDDPSEGDIYVNSKNHHIYCYLNGNWRQLDNWKNTEDLSVEKP